MVSGCLVVERHLGAIGGQEVPGAVGISKSAFLERLRRAHSELFDRLLD